MGRIVATILAAGKGERFGRDKISEDLGGSPVWLWAYRAFKYHPKVHAVGIVTSRHKVDEIRLKAPDAAFVVEGGSNRQESALLGLQHWEEDDLVLFHDAARPFVDEDTIARVISAASIDRGAAAAMPVSDTIRKAVSGEIVDRDELVSMQTPQAAPKSAFILAHKASGQVYTDEVELLRQIGFSCELVNGSESNFKITTPADLQRARSLVGSMEVRTGFGFDIHAFSNDSERMLWLGGVQFPGERALEGHSDADVILHAITDAVLGSAALGDIGLHFPNSDPEWRNKESAYFLRHACCLLHDAGFEIVNIDATMIGERPKVMAREAEIRAAVSHALNVTQEQVGFKATTNEKLGSIGRGEGISCFAVATVRRCR